MLWFSRDKRGDPVELLGADRDLFASRSSDKRSRRGKDAVIFAGGTGKVTTSAARDDGE